MADPRVGITLVVIIAAIVFRALLGGLFKRKLRELIGHQLLANALTGIFVIALIIYLLNVWGIIQALVELLVAFSAIAAVVLFAVKDIWISNLLAGVSLIGDKLVKIGTDVEVDGKRGKIVEMTLTLTKVKTADGHLMIVPNKKFREEVVVVMAKR